MRKTKHLFLAFLAVTGFTTAWASDLPGTDPDSTAAKTTYTVDWTGTFDTTYTGGQINCVSASYVDGTNVTHPLDLTFLRIKNNVVLETLYAPNDYPQNAGAWKVIASTSQSGVSLVNDTIPFSIQQAQLTVTGAMAEVAKLDDGNPSGATINNGVLNGVLGNDGTKVFPQTTAIFDNYTPGTLGGGHTITLHYALVGDTNVVKNYYLQPSTQHFTDSGIVIPNIVPDLTIQNTDTTIASNGLDLYAYGYCTGTGYSIVYHLISGAAPDQYRIDFDDSRITDVNWTDLTTPGATGIIGINFPVDLPTGDYTMNVIFRNSLYPGLESLPLTVNIHVNLPQTTTMPLFDNVIAIVDTCNCFTDIQWYHRADANDAWAAIPGATGYYYREEGGLTGEYFVKVKMNGVDTYTCPQTDLTTLIADDQQVKVSAYPNPTSESVNVTISGSDLDFHTLRIISTMGVEMESRTFESNATTIDMRSFPRGNYMVSVDGMVVRVIRN